MNEVREVVVVEGAGVEDNGGTGDRGLAGSFGVDGENGAEKGGTVIRLGEDGYDGD